MIRRIVEVADRKFTVRLTKGEGWYVVRCVEEPGAISQGRTIRSALRNIKVALTLILEDSGKIIYDDKHRAWIWVAVDNPKLRKLLRESRRIG